MIKTDCDHADLQPEPATVSAVDILDDYLLRLIQRKVPQLIKQYSALSGLEVGNGLITILGAYPGVGKTALCSQVMYDALELNDELHVVIANAETGLDVLLRRQLSRLTCIPARSIRFGDLNDIEHQSLTTVAQQLRLKLQRVSSLSRPFRLEQILRLLDDKPGLLIVDYLQKFIPVNSRDARMGVNAVMDGLRELSAKGWAVIAISATSRPTKDNAKLTMSSLRESSEIEYQADSIYLLHDEGPQNAAEPWITNVTLEHVKNRHDQLKSFELVFNKPRMEFTARSLIVSGGDFDAWGSSDPFADG